MFSLADLFSVCHTVKLHVKGAATALLTLIASDSQKRKDWGSIISHAAHT